MTAILVDSNVLLDVVTQDSVWGDWSAEMLRTQADAATMIVNAVIYAEVSIAFETIEALEVALPADVFRRESIPYEAAFLAGKAFLRYRRMGGARRSPLPDFFIGAHAAVAGHRILTRDPTRYATYFPTVELIAPG